ncbi:tRNA(m5U54)methyltransferase [Paramarasmius palmivorus]|uniref:tRNA(M5U54)methyltransferase n=1 Tax=Paramarasmius palmivorus TaxID=297713 RepID=A0AAW0CP24_9AGAR
MSSPKTGQVRPLPAEAEAESLYPGKRPKVEKEKTSKKFAKKNAKKLKKQRQSLPENCSPEDVQWKDIVNLLGEEVVNGAIEEGTEFQSPFSYHEVVELEVKAICSNGDGLAQSDREDIRPWVVVVPFTLPGERVRARIFRNERMHSMADFIEIVRPNPELRDDARIKCKYFAQCGGCQYQMLSYEKQLEFKPLACFARKLMSSPDLPSSSIPTIQPTMPSPLEYGYRTKITPHFQAPPTKINRDELQKEVAGGKNPDWLKIGFNYQGQNKVIDIEECPIATPVLNDALPGVRDNIYKTIHTYKKGATLLLRESVDTSGDAEKKVCITSNHVSIREKVGEFNFEYLAGSFFQNNNSILPSLTGYVRDAIFSLYPPEDSARPTHLIDTYCGSGLFAITLSPHFSQIAGIEISADSILYATHNARLNNIPPEKISFRSGDASDIFQTVSDFPPEKTVMVIDPPRKGCDDAFINQLLKFRCRFVAYVSCNVHTQARDVGKILKATEHEKEGEGRKYVLESLRGFDLFPQTAHVESVAILRLV